MARLDIMLNINLKINHDLKNKMKEYYTNKKKKKEELFKKKEVIQKNGTRRGKESSENR